MLVVDRSITNLPLQLCRHGGCMGGCRPATGAGSGGRTRRAPANRFSPCLRVFPRPLSEYTRARDAPWPRTRQPNITQTSTSPRA